MIYLHGWIQAIEFLLFIWFVVWAGSKILDFAALVWRGSDD
jgi:hypothetical protein